MSALRRLWRRITGRYPPISVRYSCGFDYVIGTAVGESNKTVRNAEEPR